LVEDVDHGGVDLHAVGFPLFVFGGEGVPCGDVVADVKPDAEGLIVGAVEKARIGSGPEGEESDDPFGPENR
jgi:hypothetical protein